MKETVRFAFLKTIPVMLGYLFLGLAFGLLLQEAGYSISERKIQRILKEMADSAEFGIETNKKAKPYGYRLRLPEGSLPINQMRPNESLLIRLFEEHLRFQLPERIRSCLTPVFESARSTLKEKASGRAIRTRPRPWPWSVPRPTGRCWPSGAMRTFVPCPVFWPLSFSRTRPAHRPWPCA